MDAAGPWPSSDLGEPLAIVITHAAAVIDHTQKRTGKVLALEEREASRDQHHIRSEDQLPWKGGGVGPAQVRHRWAVTTRLPAERAREGRSAPPSARNLWCAFLCDLQVTEAKLHLVHVIGGGGGCKWDGRMREWNWR